MRISETKPAFTLFCGDANSIAPYYSSTYRRVRNIIEHRAPGPVHMVPGNHDGQVLKTGPWVLIDGWNHWKKQFGPLYHSFDYGNDHYIGLNSFDWPVSKRNLLGTPKIFMLQFTRGARIGQEQFKWLEEDLRQAGMRGANIFIFMHHSPLRRQFMRPNGKTLAGDWEEESRQRLLGLLESYQVKAVFSGHQHYTHQSQWNGTLFLSTVSAASMHEKGHNWGYHMVTIQDGEIVKIEKHGLE